ncbi:MAG: hypothetical protein K5846_00760 [Bacteroidales bacterium]|nr:hypothetical protein [Bacteroidales bacterium]
MKKFVFIIAMALLFFHCDAQKSYGLLVGYSPWGAERLPCTTTIDTFFCYNTYKGHYSFGKPVLKLAFQVRNEISTHLLEVSFSSINTHRIEDPYPINYKLNQLGLVWHPGWTIMPKRRVQIPIFLGFGLNYYFGGKGYGVQIPNRLYFDLSAMAHVNVYIVNWLALYAGYSAHLGLSGKRIDKTATIDTEFRHYPEIGVLFNF